MFKHSRLWRDKLNYFSFPGQYYSPLLAFDWLLVRREYWPISSDEYWPSSIIAGSHVSNPTVPTELSTVRLTSLLSGSSRPPAENILTSQPLGVVLDSAQDSAALSETSVNHSVTCQEVRHGGRVKIPTCEYKFKKMNRRREAVMSLREHSDD